MFLNLLPGFREVRAPLTAGFLWLLFGWLVLPDISLPSEFEDFVDEFSTLGQAAALSLAAYVVGSVMTDACAPLWTAVGERKRNRAVWRFSTRREQDAREWLLTREVARTTGEPAEQYKREADQHYLQRDAAFAAYSATNEPLSIRGIQALVGLFRLDSGTLDPKAPELVTGPARELDIARFRLISEEPELYNEVDRLRGEGQFRLAVALPLLAVTIALSIVDHLAWLVALPAIGVLGSQGLDKLEESGDRVADALRARKVTVPSLETTPSTPERADDGARGDEAQESRELNAALQVEVPEGSSEP